MEMILMKKSTGKDVLFYSTTNSPRDSGHHRGDEKKRGLQKLVKYAHGAEKER